MAIEKSLFAGPQGDQTEVVEALEIEIEPEVVSLEDGGAEITLVPDLLDSDIANAPFKIDRLNYYDGDYIYKNKY